MHSFLSQIWAGPRLWSDAPLDFTNAAALADGMGEPLRMTWARQRVEHLGDRVAWAFEMTSSTRADHAETSLPRTVSRTSRPQRDDIPCREPRAGPSLLTPTATIAATEKGPRRWPREA